MPLKYSRVNRPKSQKQSLVVTELPRSQISDDDDSTPDSYHEARKALRRGEYEAYVPRKRTPSPTPAPQEWHQALLELEPEERVDVLQNMSAEERALTLSMMSEREKKSILDAIPAEDTAWAKGRK